MTVVSKEKLDRAEQIALQINAEESSSKNKALFANINDKLQDNSLVSIKDVKNADPDMKLGGTKIYAEQMDGATDRKPILAGEESKGEPAEKSSTSGVSLVTLTIDNDEGAVKFIKQLFAKKLVASVNVNEGNFERTFLKFGRMETENNRDRLEMVTTDDKVASLITFINTDSPSNKDYPRPDVIVSAVEGGNTDYIDWVKRHVSAEFALNKKDSEDALAPVASEQQ